jgi:SAM-dependent methyltransferase
MNDSDRTFAGSIPAIYEHYLGPLIFEPYATDLADRVTQITHRHVLETAAGTGIVTRALVRTLAAGVDITATDLNQPMLDFAAAQTDDGRVTWRQADALHLPFDDGSFDVVICQFGAMSSPIASLPMPKRDGCSGPPANSSSTPGIALRKTNLPP